MSDLTKPPSTPTSSDLTRKHSVSLPGLHSRLRNPKIAADNDPNIKPNRIALLLDVSGSMRGERIESLRNACQSFVTSCSFADTALAIEPFGAEYLAGRLALTCFQPICLTTVMSLTAGGGTPMACAMNYALEQYSMTRAVLVSDGQPDIESAAYEAADQYREAGIPVDCVHIGHTTGGEACLRRIAETTGGTFIKFTDINSFAKSFKYLTPAFYAQLTSGSVDAAMLGAKEIK